MYVQKPLHKSIVSYNGYVNNDYYVQKCHLHNKYKIIKSNYINNKNKKG